MDILVMIAIVFMVVSIVTWNQINLEARIAMIKQNQQKQKCTLHKWVYRKQPDTDDEYMVCNNCGMLPGCYEYIEEEEGKYDVED